MSDKNIVKKVCAELEITQKELAVKLGVHITCLLYTSPSPRD